MGTRKTYDRFEQTGTGPALDVAVADAYDMARARCSKEMYETAGCTAYEITLTLCRLEMQGSGEPHSYDNNRPPRITAVFDAMATFSIRTDEPVCRRCHRTEDAHRTTPYEYAALLAEQSRCPGFER